MRQACSVFQRPADRRRSWPHLTTVDYWYPQILPGGRGVLFTASALTVDAGDVMLLDLASKTSRTIIRRAVAGRYVPTGHLVFLREGDLWAVRFDIDRLETVGDAVPVEQGIRVEGGGAIQFAVAGDGSLFYVPSDTRAFTLVWVDRQGRETPLGVPPRTYGFPRISPDGTKLVVVAEGQGTDLWLVDLTRGASTALTSSRTAGDPVWAPDSRHVFFAQRAAAGWFNIYRTAVDRPQSPERLTTESGTPVPGNLVT